MSTHTYDYAIVGAGAAGLNIVLKMAEDEFFSSKKILIIDREVKNSDDRTWSFWEKGNSHWDHIVEKKWNHALFFASDAKVDIPLGDYHYKTIRSSKFYAFVKDKINEKDAFEWVQNDVKEVLPNTIITSNGEYSATHIFDSRIPNQFFEEEENYESLTQHFLGWFIKTKEPVFDESQMTMMDYRLKWKDHTSFTYVLPFSPNLALVEFTLFNNELLTTAEYETKVKEYINDYLHIDEYEIIEVEKGSIPMSNYPFKKHHQKGISKIGTAGGWVRPSSGYSFKNADRYSQMIIENIKKGRVPHHGVATNRFRMYDSIFLRVLKDRNDLGEEIFHILYAKQPTHSLFRFLDEESSLVEDAKIMFSLNKPEFRKSLLKSL